MKSRYSMSNYNKNNTTRRQIYSRNNPLKNTKKNKS